MRSRSHLQSVSHRPYSLLLAVLVAFIGTSNRGLAQEEDSASSDEFLSSFEDSFNDSEVEMANFQQPGSTVRPPSAVRRPSRRPATGQELAAPSVSETGDYLASAPRMFGHYYGSAGQLLLRGIDANGKANTLITDLPLGGGASRLQVADNNVALAQDRFFFNYNHFENAFETRINGQLVQAPIDQYTLGLERSIFDGIASWQLQMPVTGRFAMAGDPSFSGGQIGNLGLVAKTVVWRSDYASLAAGLGFDLPTGSSVNGSSGGTNFRIANSSLHLSPYVGTLVSPTDATFFSAFMAVDVPASGNTISIQGFQGSPFQPAGVLTAQSLMQVDLSGGRWIYQNPGGGGITGMALLAEIHYVAALQHGDVVTVNPSRTPGVTAFQLGNLANQQTVTNFTTGLHILWNDRVQFRIGGAFPLADRPNRSFDGEVIAQVNFLSY